MTYDLTYWKVRKEMIETEDGSKMPVQVKIVLTVDAPDIKHAITRAEEVLSRFGSQSATSYLLTDIEHE